MSCSSKGFLRKIQWKNWRLKKSIFFNAFFVFASPPSVCLVGRNYIPTIFCKTLQMNRTLLLKITVVVPDSHFIFMREAHKKSTSSNQVLSRSLLLFCRSLLSDGMNPTKNWLPATPQGLSLCGSSMREGGPSSSSMTEAPQLFAFHGPTTAEWHWFATKMGLFWLVQLLARGIGPLCCHQMSATSPVESGLPMTSTFTLEQPR